MTQSDQLSFFALGTKWFIDVSKKTTKTEKEIAQIVEKFEQDYSRFNTTSLLSQLNTIGQLNNAPQEMIDMLNFAKDMHQKSGGLFNISVGGELEKLGYGLTPESESAIYPDYSDFVKTKGSNISLTMPDMHLDFGGFGKGWLVDKLTDYLKVNNVTSFVINGGGDIYVRGRKPVEIHIEDPLKPSYYVGIVPVQNGSICSSSNHKRTWNKNGKKYSHIISPLKNSKSNIASMHVTASTALIADTGATILFLASPEERATLAKKLKVEYMAINEDYTISRSSGFRFRGV